MGAAGYALAGVSLIGTAVSAGAQVKAGAEAQASAEFNARMMDLEAADAVTRGEQRAGDLQREGRQMLGAQRAVLGAQGIEIGDGSAAVLQADTIRTTQDAVARVRADAALEAWGIRTNAKSVRRAGRYARAGANRTALGSTIAGATQAGAMAYDAYQKG